MNRLRKHRKTDKKETESRQRDKKAWTDRQTNLRSDQTDNKLTNKGRKKADIKKKGQIELKTDRRDYRQTENEEVNTENKTKQKTDKDKQTEEQKEYRPTDKCIHRHRKR